MEKLSLKDSVTFVQSFRSMMTMGRRLVVMMMLVVVVMIVASTPCQVQSYNVSSAMCEMSTQTCYIMR